MVQCFTTLNQVQTYLVFPPCHCLKGGLICCGEDQYSSTSPCRLIQLGLQAGGDDYVADITQESSRPQCTSIICSCDGVKFFLTSSVPDHQFDIFSHTVYILPLFKKIHTYRFLILIRELAPAGQPSCAWKQWSSTLRRYTQQRTERATGTHLHKRLIILLLPTFPLPTTSTLISLCSSRVHGKLYQDYIQ